MSKYLLFVFILSLPLCSTIFYQYDLTARLPDPSDTLTIHIQASNLTEDMSTLSSRNDEVLTFLYEFSDTSRLAQPLLTEFFVLDSARRTKDLKVVVAPDQNKFLLFLIEIDTDRSPEQIEKIVRRSFNDIIRLFRKRDLLGLQHILDDDDLIGFRIVENIQHGNNLAFSFQGRYKLDKYSYRIEVKRR